MGVALAHRVRFRDHQTYTTRDLQSLPGEICVTTEKDAVRLVDAGGAGEFLHLRISAEIPQLDGLLELIRSRLKEDLEG
jgi:tetraacyldisaccharide-1-P 4'-kinase